MHRRMSEKIQKKIQKRIQKKIYRMAMAVLLAGLLSVTPGCAGEPEEGLTELTDTGLQEGQKDKARKEEGQKEKGQKDEGSKGTEEEPQGDDPQEETGNNGPVYVHVCGAVAAPGVYRLPPGSRLYEAVQAAGGLLETAAGEWLNQAALAEDGQQVYIPSKEEVAAGAAGGPNVGSPGGPGSPAAQADDGKVNLNTATEEQLMTLSGIGKAKAGAIIAYREEHGGFQRAEDLMEVEGIKEGVFNKVKDRIKAE